MVAATIATVATVAAVGGAHRLCKKRVNPRQIKTLDVLNTSNRRRRRFAIHSLVLGVFACADRVRRQHKKYIYTFVKNFNYPKTRSSARSEPSFRRPFLSRMRAASAASGLSALSVPLTSETAPSTTSAAPWFSRVRPLSRPHARCGGLRRPARRAGCTRVYEKAAAADGVEAERLVTTVWSRRRIASPALECLVAAVDASCAERARAQAHDELARAYLSWKYFGLKHFLSLASAQLECSPLRVSEFTLPRAT